MSMTSSLPTEFDGRPDLTPTGDESHSLMTFETPEVRASPSHLAGDMNDLDTDILPDETMEQISDKHYPFAKNPKATQSNSYSSSTAAVTVGQSRYSATNRKYVISKSRNPSPPNKLYVIVRTSILSSLLLLLLFSCLVILIIESESDLFSHLRKLPEMVILRRDYYEPIKDTIWHTVRDREPNREQLLPR